MGQNWFELAEARQRQREVERAAEAADDVDASSADDSPTTLRQLNDDAEPATGSSRALPPKKSGTQTLTRKLATSQNSRRHHSSAESGSPMKTAALTLAGVLVAFVIVASSLAALFSGSSDSSTLSEAAVPPASTEKKLSLYAGECSDVAGKQRVSASPQTLNGAFAAFQTAYYGGNASSMHALIEDGSSLDATDWEEVLADTVTEGTTWCAEFGEAKANSVDVDLTVTDAQGEKVTYQQRVTGLPKGSVWQLQSIKARS